MDLEEMQEQISRALEATFIDAQIFGSGFLSIEINGDNISIKNVKPDELIARAKFIENNKKALS